VQYRDVPGLHLEVSLGRFFCLTDGDVVHIKFGHSKTNSKSAPINPTHPKQMVKEHWGAYTPPHPAPRKSQPPVLAGLCERRREPQGILEGPAPRISEPQRGAAFFSSSGNSGALSKIHDSWENPAVPAAKFGTVRNRKNTIKEQGKKKKKVKEKKRKKRKDEKKTKNKTKQEKKRGEGKKGKKEKKEEKRERKEKKKKKKKKREKEKSEYRPAVPIFTPLISSGSKKAGRGYNATELWVHINGNETPLFSPRNAS